MLSAGQGDIRAAIKGTDERGVTLVDDGRMVEMRARGTYAELVENARREEFTREVGRAGLEVLSTVLYRGRLSRSEMPRASAASATVNPPKNRSSTTRASRSSV